MYLLEIQNKALNTPEFESLQSSVTFKLKPALDVTVPQVVHKSFDDSGHEIFFCY